MADTVFVSHIDNGMQCFNHSHWLRVRAERERQGLDANRALPRGPQSNHPAIGLQFRRHSDGSLWTIRSITRDWLMGWFETAVMESEAGSHSTYIFQNMSSSAPFIVKNAGNLTRDFASPSANNMLN